MLDSSFSVIKTEKIHFLKKNGEIYCTVRKLFVSLQRKHKTITLDRAQRWGQHLKFCKSNYEDFEFCKASIS